MLRVNCWYPEKEKVSIDQVLGTVKRSSVNTAFLMHDIAEKGRTPPTYIRTNEFTEAWQEVVDTYGIPSYQESNPAVIACVTFPFIFGMMYGDVGHGTLLALAGAFLCMKGKKLLDMEGGEILYWVRFL